MLFGPTVLTLLMAGWPAPAPGGAPSGEVRICERPADPPEYYAIPLVATRQVMGTGRASGVAHTTFGASPFGVSLAPDGSYHVTLRVQVDGLPPRPRGEFVAWATTPSLDEVVKIGLLDEDGSVEGPVEWNKFLVVVTLEPEGDGSPTGWTGPIVLRGMSRSGMMHTMAGHGPFEQQECAAFGY